ncbi:MAG: hypothetical protein K6D59_01475 [Bacteroidales bacterium]|nr:hypothetical protein [Bacteroidales bacterium]
MKKVVLFGSMLLCGILMFNVANAQSKDELKKIRKEREAISKMTNDELDDKVSKVARKEAEKYEKEGWKVNPGVLPMERQLDRVYNMEYEFDDNLMPKYIFGEARSVGTAYDAAKMQAMTLAKQELAGKIATEISVLVEAKVENNQLSEEDAQSLVQAAASGQQLITQSIGRVLTVVEVYRESGKNKEVLVRVAYRTDMIMKTAKEIMRKELEKIGSDAKDKIDELFAE